MYSLPIHAIPFWGKPIPHYSQGWKAREWWEHVKTMHHAKNTVQLYKERWCLTIHLEQCLLLAGKLILCVTLRHCDAAQRFHKNRKEPWLLDLIQPYVIFALAFHAGVKRQKIIFPSNFFHSALAKEQNMQQLMWSHISLWPDRFPLSWSCRPHKPDKGDKVRRKSMWTEGQRNAWIFSGKPSMCKRVGMHM